MPGTVSQEHTYAGSSAVKTGITALAGGAQPTLEANTVSGIYNVVSTVATDNDSVLLPADMPMNTVVWVHNADAAQDIKVYPNSGGTINGGAANAALIVGQQQVVICVQIGTDGKTWLAALGAVATAA